MAISAEWYTQAVTLESADGFMPDLRANEGDANGRGIDLVVMDGAKAASMTGMSVYLAWGHEKGGEGLTPFTAVDAANGRWRVLFPTSMQRRGTVLARVMIYLAGSKTPITGSRNFRIFVEVDPVDGNTAISDNDFSVFQRAVVDLNKARADAEASTKKANDAATKATSSAKSADAATADANTATRNAASAKEEATAAAEEATKAAKAANDAARDAAESAGEADAATLKADAATKNAANSASQAQGAAGNANAAANAALQIANSIASNDASDGEVAELRQSVDKLGNMVAELSGGYLVMGGALYTPPAKATASAGTATMKSAAVTNETVSLT